jgi:hypothetical protein
MVVSPAELAVVVSGIKMGVLFSESPLSTEAVWLTPLELKVFTGQILLASNVLAPNMTESPVIAYVLVRTLAYPLRATSAPPPDPQVAFVLRNPVSIVEARLSAE